LFVNIIKLAYFQIIDRVNFIFKIMKPTVSVKWVRLSAIFLENGGSDEAAAQHQDISYEIILNAKFCSVALAPIVYSLA